MQNNIFFTKQGLEKVKKEHLELIEKRKGAVATLKRAREMGDLSENGLYKAAKFELGDIDRTLRRLSHFINNGVIAVKPKGKIGIGSKVTVIEERKKKEFKIVGDFEANPTENKISANSPLGKALMDMEKGHAVEIKTPGGKKSYKILTVS
jgi:transcription elongation factor GreA